MTPQALGESVDNGGRRRTTKPAGDLTAARAAELRLARQAERERHPYTPHELELERSGRRC